MEIETEKHFLKDASGKVTGYSRSANGNALPGATRIVSVDTLQGSEDFFNSIGWNFLENKKFEEAIQYLQRGLKLYPHSLLLKGNLAHTYLFSGKYKDAVQIYSADLESIIQPGMSWT